MTSCPSCQAEVPVGQRWCSICHGNVFRPELGRLASPARRLAAWFMDFFIPLVVLIMMIGGSVAAGNFGLFLIAFLGYVIWAFILFSRGMTPGKKLMGIQVVKEDGGPANFVTMLIRETFGKWISGLVFGLGWIWILIDKDRQGWHDKLVSTFVMKRETMPDAAPFAAVASRTQPPPRSVAIPDPPSPAPLPSIGMRAGPVSAERTVLRRQSMPTTPLAGAATIHGAPAAPTIPGSPPPFQVPRDEFGSRPAVAPRATNPTVAPLTTPSRMSIYCGMCGHFHASTRTGEKCQRCGADLE
ncbi:MAG: RDD family protein [Gemmatimonadales bacterium]